MNRQLDHMVRLVDDLLDVARVSRGLLELKRERLELSEIVKEAVLDLKPIAATRSLSIVSTVDARVIVHADRTRIRQIIGNLLDNAAKYSLTGGTIRLSLEREGDRVSVRVSDEGIGIPADQQARVFDMFTRVHRSGAMQAGGLGLGLAIGRQLAEMHGGALTVESPGDGLGSTFTLTLPAEEATAEDLRSGDSQSREGASPGRLSVLLIEDNVDAAEILALWLEDLGHSVQIARNGLEGLELVETTHPAVVLCDIGLPGIDGVEVCKRVKALAGGGSPYMVALTGWGMAADREQTREAGFEQHLVKPVALETLRELLQTIAAERAS